MLMAKERLSANAFSDVNPGEPICGNERSLIHNSRALELSKFTPGTGLDGCL